MKNTHMMYARYSQRANDAVLGLLDALEPAQREAARKSHYGSLGGLFRHVYGGTLYMHGLIRASNPAFAALLDGTACLGDTEQPYSDSLWSGLKADSALADRITVGFVSALDEQDFKTPIKLNWYGGNPPAVPLHFILHQMLVHGTHHRGQISQILDEMGIEHDFSGIDLEFLGE